jgi:hypothetical protein
MFRFDTKGEFITDDESFIRRATGIFDSQEIIVDMKETETKKKIKKTVEEPILKIETMEEKLEEKPKKGGK